MPNVIAPERLDSNGDVYITFVDSVGTSSTNYTYAQQQNGITVRNFDDAVMTVTINATPYTVSPKSTRTIVDSFTVFSIVTSSGFSGFTATSIRRATASGLGDMLKSSYDVNSDGVIDKAAKLATTRTIALTGSVTGSASFDGSADITIATTGGGGGGGNGNPLAGLKVGVFGASFSQVNYPSGGFLGYPPIKWWQHIDNRCGTVSTCVAIAGSCVTSSTANYATDTTGGVAAGSNHLNQIDIMGDNFDIVLAMIGSNDEGNVVPLGTFTDRVVTTYFGALHNMCQKLTVKYPRTAVGIMAPLYNPTNYANETSTYVDALKRVCNYYGIPVLDLRQEGRTPFNFGYWMNQYAPDGTHLTTGGNEIISHSIEGFMRRIIGSPSILTISTLFSDTYDRANSATTLGSSWTAVAGTFGISSNEGYCVSDANGDMAINSTALTANDFIVTCDMKGDVTDGTNTNVRKPSIVVRYVDANNYWYVNFFSNQFVLCKYESGTVTVLATSTSDTFANNTYYNIKVKCIGSTFYIAVNYLWRAAYTMTGAENTKYGNSKLVGKRLSKSGTPSVAARWDNYKVESIII
jgi:lysophospholipase L1-like esterase